ncbi:MAG: phospholipase D-like domain-containing protein [Leptolyngbyaceae cyanobacterium bins.302]|nr:phospholipase D-like domain-containing protein [Leptolyngbyaceae cyanobacterium bins.302]
MQLHFFSASIGFAIFSTAIVLATGGCQPETPQVIRPTPLPQDKNIQVFMNHDPAASYTEPYRGYTRAGSNLEQVIIDTIATARSSVDVAVQELRLPGIAQALAERHKAGIKVRVVLENTYARPYSQFTAEDVANLPERERDRYQEARRLIDLNGDEQLGQNEIDQRDALVMLNNAQIPRIDDTADGSAGSNLMHHKFLVIDQQTVIVSSANLTTSDVHGDFKSQHSRGNANNLLKINSPELATVFTEEFNYLWGDGPGNKSDSLFGIKKTFHPARQIQVGSTTIEVQFSPSSKTVSWEQSTNGLISRTLTGAMKSIQMALFVFSDQHLVNQLEPVQQKGITIQALIDPGFAYRPYSEALDMMGVSLLDDCRSEENNHPWKTAIATVGVPRLTPGDLLHHKFGIVDQRTTIAGSHNWTDAANRGNDETLLVINNEVVTAHYQREFERLYTNAILGVPPAIQKKAIAQAQNCPVTASTQPQATLVQTTAPAAIAPQTKPPFPPKTTQIRSLTPKTTHQATSTPKQQINLNTATQTELEELPGVGPGLAKRIMAARQKKRFTSLADLDQVSGVGPKLLLKLKDRVTW